MIPKLWITFPSTALPGNISECFASSMAAQGMCESIIFGLKDVPFFTRKSFSRPPFYSQIKANAWGAFAHPFWASERLKTPEHSVRAVQRYSIDHIFHVFFLSLDTLDLHTQSLK